MLCTATVLFGVSLISSSAFATSIKTPGIRGSDHDFSKFTLTKTSTSASTGIVTTTALDEICIYCHAPHRNGQANNSGVTTVTTPGTPAGVDANGNATPAIPGTTTTTGYNQDAPLWNHQLSSATYIPYSSATLKANVGQPNGVSKLCLGCHDGTIAIEAYSTNTGAGGHFISDAQFGTGSKVIGTDLTNDHPVSFTYDSALLALDSGLRPVTSPIIDSTGILIGATKTPAGPSQSMTGTIADLLDRNGQVQCTSCHDVHNGQGINKLLKINNTGSALCLTCHNK
jgi:predicted CXXCH cytochrome family protein